MDARPRLAAEARRQRAVVRPYLGLYAERAGEPETLGHEHDVIVDALRDRDGRRAERLVVAHVLANSTSIVALLANRPASAAPAPRPRSRAAVKAPG